MTPFANTRLVATGTNEARAREEYARYVRPLQIYRDDVVPTLL